MLSEGQVGIQLLNDGANQTIRLTKLAAQVIQELHGRFYEQTYRGNVYTYGQSNFALTAASAVASNGAAATPIVGLWNPLTSPVNLVILQASINITTIPASATALNGFVWVYSAGNSNITTGANGVNCKTYASPGGSYARCYSNTTALTGLTNTLSTMRNSAITCLNAAGATPAVTLMQGVTVENIDAGIIVPPGGFIGMQCGAAPTTAISVSTGIVWEEVPI